MRIHPVLAAFVIALSCASCALSDVQDAEPTGPAAATMPVGAPRSTQAIEPTEEAKEPMTKAECHAQWNYQSMKCNEMPPDLRTTCWWVSSVILAGCLATAS